MKQRLFKANARRIKLILAAGGLLALSSCLKERDWDCPDDQPAVLLRFEYTMNTRYTDKFAEYARSLDVFIYTSDGNYLKTVTHSDMSGVFADGNKLGLDLAEGEYTAIVWANLGPEYHCVHKDGIDRHTVAVRTAAGGTLEERPGHLMHGLARVIVEEGTQNEFLVPMTKNTNDIQVILNIPCGGAPVAETDFVVSASGRNGAYKHDNTMASEEVVKYISRNTVDGSVYRAEMRTLRLLPGDDSRLSITRGATRSAGITLPSDLSLTDEIMRHPDINGAEDLERQDQFILEYELAAQSDGQWTMTLIKVNNWDLVHGGGSIGH